MHPRRFTNAPTTLPARRRILVVGLLVAAAGLDKSTPAYADPLAGDLQAAGISTAQIVRIEVFPETLHFTGPGDRRRLIVSGYDAAGNARDLTHVASFSSSAPSRTTIEGAVVQLNSAVLANPNLLNQPSYEPPPLSISGRGVIPAAHRSGEYDLATDFERVPGGTSAWSFQRTDGQRLVRFAEKLSGIAGDFPKQQPKGWQISEQVAVPLIAQADDPQQSGTPHDAPESRIFCHAPLSVHWTAPHAGTVSIRGGVWMLRDLNRHVKLSLETSRFDGRDPLFREITIPDRDGDDDGNEDGPNSLRPLSFAEAMHFAGRDPKLLTTVSVAEGDQLVITGEGGDFFGLDWHIRYSTPVPDSEQVEEQANAQGDQRVEPANEIPANGSATVSVRVDGLSQDVPITWANDSAPKPVSFRYDVLPTITRLGCNAGACHASPHGKGGFHLSLRGQEPTADWEAIFYGEGGRRVSLAEPAASLLLRKPLMDVRHGGGQRLLLDELAYQTVRNWIEQGCQIEVSDSPSCVGLEVYPSERTLPRDARSQQLMVLAHYSDGSVRDVTSLTLFTSSDEETAHVDADGRVTGLQRGQAAVLAQYDTQTAAAYLAWTEDSNDFIWCSPPEQNYVDRHNFAQLRRFQIQPSGLCSDGVFLRRVYLDVTGRLPTVEETAGFLDDNSGDKRQQLINDVLLQPEFAEYWALKWADLLRVRNKSLTSSGVRKMYQWLVASMRENVPLDEFARSLLLAQGGTFEHPQANYYRAAETPEDCAETTAELFLGIKIKCAKCHNHPYDRWTQDNYHGLAAFFNRVERQTIEPPQQEGAEQPPAGDLEMFIRLASGGETIHPRTGAPVQPWLPGLGTLDTAAGDRRQLFADWLVEAGNPFFGRVAVNRIWYQIFGRGLVDPIDDFRESNPAVNRELLDALAADFVEHGFDRRHILRVILASSTYQLTAQPNPSNASDETFLSRARPRRLSAEQLLDAICHVTNLPEQLGDFPIGTRAAAMPSPDANHPFLQSFGQPQRMSACVCERSQEPDFAQALQMVNGDVIQNKLKNEDNRFHRMLREGRSNEEVIIGLYMAALCRRATDEELDVARAHVAAADDPALGIEDVCWALINSKEFLFRY